MDRAARWTIIFSAIAILSACKPAEAPISPTNQIAVPTPAVNETVEANVALPDAAEPIVAIAGDGLRLVVRATGSSRAIPFGHPQAEVIAMVERLFGRSERGDNPECGAGPMQFVQWQNGLHLTFQKGKFVGWSIDQRGPSTISTMDGLFVGATRADVMAGGTQAKIFESTLGTEFTVGDIGGMLDGPGSAANVTNLWAGSNCMFR